jgi:hypothetical protein
LNPGPPAPQAGVIIRTRRRALTKKMTFLNMRLSVPDQLHYSDLVGVWESMALFASCVVSVAFRFWSVLSFSCPLLVMLLTFFDSHKHPIVFFVNASAKQRLSRQETSPIRSSHSISRLLRLATRRLPTRWLRISRKSPPQVQWLNPRDPRTRRLQARQLIRQQPRSQ